jgi:hypothetical protein
MLAFLRTGCAMRSQGLRLTAGLLSCFSGSLPAQQTTTFAYDGLGRLTNSGESSQSTKLYLYDNAGNRQRVRCCNTIGGWQVREDGFDSYFYLQTYSDVRISGMDPYEHWLQYGATENRRPNLYFDTSWYRSTYNVPASVNPLTEYHTTGWRAGRNPSLGFSTIAYHANYPDTIATDPLQHYLRYGYGEGRLAFSNS